MQNKLVSRWVRPQIDALSAYSVVESEGLIKLDAMENPYPWPDDLRQEWLALLQAVDVNRYPHPQAPALKEQLRKAMQIPASAKILLGNGSDELIQMIAMTLGGPGRVVLSVEPGFVMYKIIACFTGMNYVGVPLQPETFELDSKAILTAIEQYQPAVIFLAFPNNPTGNLFSIDTLLQIIRTAPGMVVIDEAYAPFTKASFIPRLGVYPNLLVMRTLSKMGLAGLRLGLLIGSSEWIEQIDKTRLPYNINTLTQVTAELVLKNRSVLDRQTEAIKLERARLHKALSAISNIKAYPSEANFILFRLPQGQGVRVYETLRTKGLLLKNLHTAHAYLQDCLRLTVGTPAENNTFLDVLDGLL